MNFSERLNRYIDEIGCSAKELAEASGISTAAISRYRKGERVPDPDGRQLRMLATGIASLSDGHVEAQRAHVELATAISGIAVDYNTFLANLNAVVNAIGANNNELARALSFDPSYISRILAGQRRPADTSAFVVGVSRFISRRCTQEHIAENILSLTDENWGAIEDERHRANAIAVWLTTNYTPVRNPINSFLEKLDAFNLDDFIRSIKFDEMKVPTAPVQLPTTKSYSGLKEMMDCEIDFLKAAVLSRSSADVIMFSDMPLEDMAADQDFPKKWMYGMAMMLKKGLHLNMIHNTGRPLPEMLLGLEGWIPMYMTGQISPYYFESMQNDVFCHILKVAGTVAMQGEAIAGHQPEGRYILTKNRDEVRYYRRRAERMLEKARPLMEIITEATQDKLEAFLTKDETFDEHRRIIMGTLPIGAMPDELLERVLARNNVPGDDRQAIRRFAETSRSRLTNMLERCETAIEVPALPRNEFDQHAPALELSGMFYHGTITYTPDEYAEHLDALKSLLGEFPSSTIKIDAGAPFRNTNITVCKGRYALVSKSASPVIHFVIEHPEMVAAFERFDPPLVES